MATPAEKLAQSLEVLRNIQNYKGSAVFKSSEISRTHKERLLNNGFIQEVIKGWYISANPNDTRGESTAWYTSFWSFCSTYLNNRFGDNWCVSPEHSISIHSGNWTVPQQLLVRASQASNNVTELPHNTSIMDAVLSFPEEEIENIEGIRIYSLASALIFCSQDYFVRNSIDTRTALSLIKDSSEILTILLDGGHSRIAGRLAGAFRNIGKDRIADDIIKTMKSAEYDVREVDPFTDKTFTSSGRELSPYVSRLKIMWDKMRSDIIENFPKSTGLSQSKEELLKNIQDHYETDAYHSLSIEGYQVTTDLIEKVANGDWDPENNQSDRELKNTLAARGYYLAFQEVKKSIEKLFSGENSGKIADDDHRDWYRALFSPSVTAGILKRSDLAGYRTHQVYISQSSHIPLKGDSVRDAMPILFELLKEEENAAVRAVLGHFIFVYIHPYMDGNGRIARFLMNLMLVSGGYPWTIIPVEKRDEYMKSLEKASVNQNIELFARFIGKFVTEEMEKT